MPMRRLSPPLSRQVRSGAGSGLGSRRDGPPADPLMDELKHGRNHGSLLAITEELMAAAAADHHVQLQEGEQGLDRHLHHESELDQGWLKGTEGGCAAAEAMQQQTNRAPEGLGTHS